MRSMRLAKREINDEAELQKLVEDCQVLRVGTRDDEGMFIVPVNFGVSWHGRKAAAERGEPIASFYVHSAREGRKATCWSAGGAAGAPVAVELDRDGGNITGSYACAYSRAYASVMGSGRVFAVSDEAERAYALERIMAHTAPSAPATFTPAAIARVAIFRIDVTHLTGKKREPKAQPNGFSVRESLFWHNDSDMHDFK